MYINVLLLQTFLYCSESNIYHILPMQLTHEVVDTAVVKASELGSRGDVLGPVPCFSLGLDPLPGEVPVVSPVAGEGVRDTQCGSQWLPTSSQDYLSPKLNVK